MCHFVDTSYAWAARNTDVSSNRSAMTWRPIGNPSSVKPHGRHKAGMPAIGAIVEKENFLISPSACSLEANGFLVSSMSGGGVA